MYHTPQFLPTGQYGLYFGYSVSGLLPLFPQKKGHLLRGHFWESLVFRLHSKIGQIHLSIEAQCDHHTMKWHRFQKRLLKVKGAVFIGKGSNGNPKILKFAPPQWFFPSCVFLQGWIGGLVCLKKKQQQTIYTKSWLPISRKMLFLLQKGQSLTKKLDHPEY